MIEVWTKTRISDIVFEYTEGMSLYGCPIFQNGVDRLWGFGRLPWRMPEVGLVAWRKDLRGWVERHNAEKNGGGYVMI